MKKNIEKEKKNLLNKSELSKKNRSKKFYYQKFKF